MVIFTEGYTGGGVAVRYCVCVRATGAWYCYNTSYNLSGGGHAEKDKSGRSGGGEHIAGTTISGVGAKNNVDQKSYAVAFQS